MPVLKKKPARSLLTADVRVRFIEGYLGLGLLRQAAAELRAIAAHDPPSAPVVAEPTPG